jgi:hypothetical protein
MWPRVHISTAVRRIVTHTRPACSTVVAIPPPLPPLILRLAHLQPGSGSSGSTTTSALRAETVGRAAVGVADAGVKAGLVRLLFFNHLFLCNITTAAKSLTYETFACVAMWWFRGATPRFSSSPPTPTRIQRCWASRTGACAASRSSTRPRRRWSRN